MKASNTAAFAIIAMLLSATTALAYSPVYAQAQVGVGVGAEVKVGSSEDKEKSQNTQSSDTESHSVSEIRVIVSEGKASVKIQSDGNTNAYVLDTDNETEILASIQSETGLSEQEIKSIWSFEVKSDTKSSGGSEVSSTSKANVSVGLNSEAKPAPKEKAIEIIAELKQRLTLLEQRFQTLLVKLETGAYFGNTLGGDDDPKSYTLSVTGTASSVSEISSEAEYSGEIHLESIVARDNQSKFKVTGGHITIDGETYQILFGKTRSSLGFSGEKDTMVVICQVLDSKGDTTTMKLLLKAASEFEGNFGAEPEPVNVVMPSSKIASKWFLDGSGTVTLA